MSSGLLDRVRVEYLLAESEAELILAEAEAGESVTNAIRPLNKAERRAKVRFGEIEKAERKAAEKAAQIIAENVQLYIIAIIGEVFGPSQAIDSAALAAKLTSINALIPHAAKDSMNAAAESLAGVFAEAHTAGSSIALDEARRQGVTGLPKPKVAPAGKFAALGQAVALHAWTRLTTRLQADYLNPSVLVLAELTRDAFEKAANNVGTAGAEDLARQSIHSAHGAGRISTAEDLAPDEVYSSELMDGATCGPCARVDGKDYDDLVEAKHEYETGGYGACQGGARCRGTLVFIYPPGRAPELPELPPLPPAPKPAPVVVKPAPAPKVTPEPDAIAPEIELPKRPTATPQRYDQLRQLPAPRAEIRAMSGHDHALIVNPGYKSGSKNYSNNCTSVVAAMELRRRGIDSFAAPVKAGKGRYDAEFIGGFWKNRDGSPVEAVVVSTLPEPKVAPGAKKPKPGGEMAVAKMEEAILAMPDGARGAIVLSWTTGGGHTFNWEKVDGKVVYLEGQVGRPDASGHVKPGMFKSSSLKFFRMDDKIPTTAATEAFETRPATLDAEIKAKEERAAKKKADPNRKLTVAEMRAESMNRRGTDADGKFYFIAAKYRKRGGKWEAISEAEQAEMKAEYLKFVREHLNIEDWKV